jgi:hypothetical protein
VNLVRIEGDAEIAGGLGDIADAIVVWTSFDQLEDGRVSVAAYATDRALTEIEGRGLNVKVVSDNAALEARLEELLGSVGREEPPLVG